MSKSEEAVRYIISVFDEVRGNWRERPDHVEQKLLEAEAEIDAQSQPPKQVFNNGSEEK